MSSGMDIWDKDEKEKDSRESDPIEAKPLDEVEIEVEKQEIAEADRKSVRVVKPSGKTMNKCSKCGKGPLMVDRSNEEIFCSRCGTVFDWYSGYPVGRIPENKYVESKRPRIEYLGQVESPVVNSPYMEKPKEYYLCPGCGNSHFEIFDMPIEPLGSQFTLKCKKCFYFESHIFGDERVLRKTVRE